MAEPNNPQATSTNNEELRRLKERISALEIERSTWEPHWHQCGRYTFPRAGRYESYDINRTRDFHRDIYDSTAIEAVNVLTAGLMSGSSNPARKWFSLNPLNKQLRDNPVVKQWVYDTVEVMHEYMARSNLYRALPTIYRDTSVYGTAAAMVEQTEDGSMHVHNLANGEYMLDVDFRGAVDTLITVREMQADSIVAEFGYEKCSSAVQQAYKNNRLSARFRVWRVIEPRLDYDPSKSDNQNMPWKVTHFEDAENDRILRVSGFRNFPVIAPRWEVRAGDTYGYGPVMENLGHIKELQHLKTSKALILDHQTDPSLQIPTTLKGRANVRLPGGEVFFDQEAPYGGIRRTFEINFDLNFLLQDIEDVRNQLRRGLFYNLFQGLSSDVAIQANMTATQVAQIYSEQLLMLGPVSQRMHNELHKKIVDLAFAFLADTPDGLPPLPPQLEGQELDVEFVSVFAQAQRAAETGSTARFVSDLAGVASIQPSVLDKFNADAYIDAHAEDLGINPKLVVPTEQADRARRQRQEEQQRMQDAALLNQNADSASKLSSSNVQGNNALASLLGGG